MTDYTLTGDTANRLLRILTQWERHPIQGPSGTIEVEKEVPNFQLVKVDAGAWALGPTATYAPAHVVVFNSGSGELDTYGSCYLIEANGRTLYADEVYLARSLGYINLGDSELPVFTMAMPCCTSPPTDCCDLEATAEACVSFSSIAIYYDPTLTYEPITTLPAEFNVGAYTVANGLIGTMGGSTSHHSFFCDIAVFCDDGQLWLYIDQLPTGGGGLRLPLTVVSCDPLSLTYEIQPGCFNWPIDGNTVQFCGTITITAGLC